MKKAQTDVGQAEKECAQAEKMLGAEQFLDGKTETDLSKAFHGLSADNQVQLLNQRMDGGNVQSKAIEALVNSKDDGLLGKFLDRDDIQADHKRAMLEEIAAQRASDRLATIFKNGGTARRAHFASLALDDQVEVCKHLKGQNLRDFVAGISSAEDPSPQTQLLEKLKNHKNYSDLEKKGTSTGQVATEVRLTGFSKDADEFMKKAKNDNNLEHLRSAIAAAKKADGGKIGDTSEAIFQAAADWALDLASKRTPSRDGTKAKPDLADQILEEFKEIKEKAIGSQDQRLTLATSPHWGSRQLACAEAEKLATGQEAQRDYAMAIAEQLLEKADSGSYEDIMKSVIAKGGKKAQEAKQKMLDSTTDEVGVTLAKIISEELEKTTSSKDVKAAVTLAEQLAKKNPANAVPILRALYDRGGGGFAGIRGYSDENRFKHLNSILNAMNASTAPLEDETKENLKTLGNHMRTQGKVRGVGSKIVGMYQSFFPQK